MTFNLTVDQYYFLNKIKEKGGVDLEFLRQQKYPSNNLPKVRDIKIFLNKDLIKKTRNKGTLTETYLITEKGIKELIRKEDNLKQKTRREKPVREPKRVSRKNKLKASLKEERQKKKQKIKDVEPKIKDNWLEWTNPIYVEENKRWEFYQKRGDKILEIYHHEDEKEIREQHQEKILSHVMASMKEENENKEINRKPGLNKNKNRQLENYRNFDTKKYLTTEEIRTIIIEERLKGIPTMETVDKLKNNTNLSYITLGMYYSEAMEEIKEKSKEIIYTIISDHLERYEELFRWFKENNYPKNCLKVLEKKEKLIGLHDNETMDNSLLHIFNKEEGEGRYNWNKLTTEEKDYLQTIAKRIIRTTKIK